VWVWAAIDLFAAEVARVWAASDLFDSEFGRVDRDSRCPEDQVGGFGDAFAPPARATRGASSSSTYTTPSAFAVDQQPTAAHAAERKRTTGRWERPS
jgi:hypothetical protein